MADSTNIVKQIAETATDSIVSTTTNSYPYELLSERVDDLHNMMNSSYSSISAQFDSLNMLVSVTAIVIAAIATFVTAYVTYLLHRIKDINQIVTEKEKNIKTIKDEIDNNVDNLYSKLRREETRSLLKRLEDVPLDVSNIADMLLSRDLEKEDFYTLKNAFLKLKDKDFEKQENRETANGMLITHYGAPPANNYLILFFQHFAGMSLQDDYIWTKMLLKIDMVIESTFDNDIQKSLSDMADVLKDRYSKLDRVKRLSEILDAYNRSKYKDNAELLNSFKVKINDDEIWKNAEQLLADKKQEKETT